MRDEPLTWTSRAGGSDGVTVLELTGPLTLGNIFDLQKTLIEMKDPVTIVDLSGVPFMDSAGLGVLVNFYVAAEKNGRRTAVAGANMRVEALIESTRLREVLRTSASVEEAEAKVRSL